MTRLDIDVSAARAAVNSAESSAQAYNGVFSDLQETFTTMEGSLTHSPGTLHATSHLLGAFLAEGLDGITSLTSTAINSTREAINAYVEGDDAMRANATSALAGSSSAAAGMPGGTMMGVAD